MDAGAVQALAVVLGDRLPVGRDLIGGLAGATERLDAVALQVSGELAGVVADVGRLAAQVYQDQAPDGGHPHRHQAPARGVEVLDPLHVGRRLQLAVEPVGPAVVGALDPAAHAPLGLVDQPRPAMPAHVEEGPRAAVLRAHHDDAVGADLAHQVAPRLGHPGDVAHADPAAEDRLELPFEDPGINERSWRQHRGPLQGLERGLDLTGLQVERGRRLRLGAQASPPVFPTPGLIFSHAWVDLVVNRMLVC